MEPELPKNLYFTSNLRFLRRTKGLSQEAFAQALGLKRGNIVSYEKGLAEPNLKNLLAISEFLGVSIEDLVKVNFEDSILPTSMTSRGPISTHSTNETLQKSHALGEVIRGIRAYHDLHQHSESMSKDQLLVDLSRCMEIAEQLVLINQQLAKE